MNRGHRQISYRVGVAPQFSQHLCIYELLTLISSFSVVRVTAGGYPIVNCKPDRREGSWPISRSPFSLQFSVAVSSQLPMLATSDLAGLCGWLPAARAHFQLTSGWKVEPENPKLEIVFSFALLAPTALPSF